MDGYAIHHSYLYGDWFKYLNITTKSVFHMIMVGNQILNSLISPNLPRGRMPISEIP